MRQVLATGLCGAAMLAGCQLDSPPADTVTVPMPIPPPPRAGAPPVSPPVVARATAPPVPIPPPNPPASPAPTAPPVPPPPPPAPHAFAVRADWDQVALGREPSWFRDPSTAAGRPYWLAAGTWYVTTITTPAYTGRVFRAEDEAPQPYLSFRVLDTPSLPERYRVTASVQPVSSPHFKPPVGEISIIPYYRDPTHYMEVLLTNDHVGIWLADGAAPDTDEGWTGLHFLPVTTGIGDVRQVTIDMDLSERRLTVTTGDQTYSLTHDFLRPRDPRVAVRSAGNTFNLLTFEVQGLSD